MTVLTLPEKRELAQRVIVSGYYTDGGDLYEVEQIGATGCVVFRSCVTGWDRCLSIEDFRARLWLVRTPVSIAA